VQRSYLRINRPFGKTLDAHENGSIADTKKSAQGERHREIVDISTRLLLENGFAGTSMAMAMAMVAKASGLTKTSLYHHFTGKDDLFAACVSQGHATELARRREISGDAAVDASSKMQGSTGRAIRGDHRIAGRTHVAADRRGVAQLPDLRMVLP
jgi:AcrR family transcriptional regulator